MALTALVMGLVFASAAQLGPDVEPASSSAPAASAPVADQGTLVLESCQQRLLARDYLAASVCYRDLAATDPDPDRRRTEAELGALAADMATGDERPRLRPTAATKPEPESESGFAAVDYIASGRAELVATAGLYGLWMGGLGAAATLFLVQSASVSSSAAAFVLSSALLMPVVGGAVGLAAAAIASVSVPDLSAGDVNLLRVAMLAGWLNAISAMFLLDGMGVTFNSYSYGSELTLPPAAAPLLMAGISGIPLFMALAAVPFVDLPDGGPALASSVAIWGSAIALFGLGAFQVAQDQWPLAIGITGLGADVAALIALGLSTEVAVSRPETWALDIGALLGLGAGAALAFGLGAPNPMLGYGAMGGGILLGGAAGFASAFLARRLLEGLTLPELPDVPNVVAVAPLLAPGSGRGSRSPLVGMTIGFSF